MKIIVKQIIESKNTTIRQAAKSCGMHHSTLIDICSEKVMPRLDTLEKIAEGLISKNTVLKDAFLPLVLPEAPEKN